MASLVGSRVTDLVDATSSRVLAGDDAAWQLAFLAEAIAATVPREQVVAAVLRRNLLLDGTFLALLRPMLDGGAAPAMDPARLTEARETLVGLLEDLAALRHNPGAARAQAPTTLDQRLDALADIAGDLPTDDLRPFLVGARSDEDVASFILGSYSLFLQTFLLRSTLRMVPNLLRNPQLEGSE